MSTTFVEAHVSTHIAQATAQEAAAEVLAALAKRERPYDRLSLSIRLRDDLQMPIDAVVAVPVVLKVEIPAKPGACTIEIAAESATRFFPTFKGLFGVRALGPSACELWLQGTYEPPLGTVGSGIDATFMRGAAKKSLRAFLDWISTEVTKNVTAAKRAHVEQVWSIYGLL